MNDDALDDAPDEDIAVFEVPILVGAKKPPAMPRGKFFDRVIAGVRSGVVPDLRDFKTRSHGYLLKLHYDNERVHYEIWPDTQRGTIEIGLHFEDGPVSTAAYLQYFDARIVELKHLLGTEVELERWTVSWGHIYYLIPINPLDGAKATETAQLLSRLIDVLEPLVRQAAVGRERVDQPAGRLRFERRKRA